MGEDSGEGRFWIPDVQIFQDNVLKNASGMTGGFLERRNCHV